MVDITEKVQKSIEKIRPFLQDEGGDIELVGVEKGVVTVRLHGECAGCPMAAMTLKSGVENFLKKDVPEVERVQAVE
jgi:Fe-S cluster biogenesis protein NfuA